MIGAGVLGMSIGTLLSTYVRPKYQWIDPVIMGVGLLISSILLLFEDTALFYVHLRRCNEDSSAMIKEAEGPWLHSLHT